MMLLPDLFSFAYVPNWYAQLDELAEMALPEPWRFKNPIYLTKNPYTPILERYIHAIFKKQLKAASPLFRMENPRRNVRHSGHPGHNRLHGRQVLRF